MNNERELLKQELFEVDETVRAETARAEQLCGHIRAWLNPLLHPPAEMRIAEAAGLMDELVVVQAELLRLSSRAEALKRALYD